MTKIDIISGFLGAGKTTLIQKLLREALQDTKVVLIENEFGEIGIDGGFLKDAGVEMKEMNSGCICCSLVGDFGASLQEVLDTYAPDRILIEPSGVGKLSDVMRAVQNVKAGAGVSLNSAAAVVDASKCKMYAKNFGEFFLNQIENAGTVILSRTDKISEDKLAQCMALIREHNPDAAVITTPWEQLEGGRILETMEGAGNLEDELMEEVKARHGHGCGHDGEHEHCGHGHDGEHEHHCGHGHDGEHEHHCGHSHDQEGHHHDHGPDCACGCHDHEHGGEHGHHHADEVFTSWGIETALSYTEEEIARRLEQLEREKEYGFVLRAKGMLPAGDGTWNYFDYVPGECDIREGKADYTGKICVIGSGLQEDKLAQLFQK